MTKQFLKNRSIKCKIALGSLLISMILSMVFTSVSFAAGGGRYSVDAWSFGVMADTQWTVASTYVKDENGNYVLDFDGDPTGQNPEYVSAALARTFQNKFIDAGVKFVIQVGDLTDRAGDAGMAARAAAAQPLIDAGIGFYPLRGNHETYGYLYWRDPDQNVNIPAFKSSFPQTQGTANTFGATNFSSPDIDILNGLSYSFDYGDNENNARFVIVDVEATESTYEEAPYDSVYGQGYFYIWWTVFYSGETGIVDGLGNVLIAPETYFRVSSSGSLSTNFYGFEVDYPVADYIVSEKGGVDGEYWPADQQSWITERLDKTTRATEHAFVLSHRGLMGANHADGLFGGNPGVTPDAQNTFYASLADNGVKYMLSGHDHLHNRAIVTSPDGSKQVQQIIHMAGSTKFYGPDTLDSFSDTKDREKQIAQDLYNVGYYIYTVDGPRVNVEYYADATGNFLDGEDYPYGPVNAEEGQFQDPLHLPDLNFVKKENYGYSTNGQEFMIAQGESYTVVEDSFGSTNAKIISGTNNSSSTDFTPYAEEEQQVIDENEEPVYVPVLDENGEQVYEQATDENGDPLFDEFDEPVMEAVVEPLMETIVVSAPRKLNKTVNTGWVKNPDPLKLKSDIFSIWGMGEVDKEQTDTYVLSMNFKFRRASQIKGGLMGIATYVDGKWVNAVNENFGGRKRFVVGPYSEKYGLGTYGVDPATSTAWAVLNYNADFAVANGIGVIPQKRTRVRR